MSALRPSEVAPLRPDDAGALAACRSPAQADKLLTQRLKEVLALVDVRTLDHIVVVGEATTSFAECGLL